jgi:hypothetical protein
MARKHLCLTKRKVLICPICGCRKTVFSDTVMAHTHLPTTKWFLAVWLMVEGPMSPNVRSFQAALDLSNYRTAWRLHSLIRKHRYPRGNRETHWRAFRRTMQSMLAAAT